MDQWDRLLSVECKRYQQAGTPATSKCNRAGVCRMPTMTESGHSPSVGSGDALLLQRPSVYEFSVPPPLVLRNRNKPADLSQRVKHSQQTRHPSAPSSRRPTRLPTPVNDTDNPQPTLAARGVALVNSPTLESEGYGGLPLATDDAAVATWATWLRRFHTSSDPSQFLLTALQSDPDTWRKLVRRFTLSLRQSSSTSSVKSTNAERPRSEQRTPATGISGRGATMVTSDLNPVHNAGANGSRNDSHATELMDDTQGSCRARRDGGRFISGCHSCASSTTADSGRYPPEPQGLFRSSRRSNGSTASSVLSSRRSSEVNRLWERAESLC